VIPTVIVLGLIVGRWWLLPVAALAWSALLLATGTIELAETPAAGALALTNCAVGVVIHKASRDLLRAFGRSFARAS
jgi:hypothetical protein